MNTDDHVPPEVDAAQFKAALSCLASGVTVATTAASSGRHGVTANAVISVSLAPLLVLISIQTGTRMYAAMRNSDNFALSVLSAKQRELADYFADPEQSHDEPAFTVFPCHVATTGAPLLDGALAHVDCITTGVIAAGDHTLFLGRAVHVASSESGTPLLYFRGELR